MDLFFIDLQHRYNLSNEAVGELMVVFKPVSYIRKQTFSEEATYGRYALFVFKGLIRAYFLKDAKDHTAFFALEGQMLSTFLSLKNTDNLLIRYETLEDSILYKAPKEKLENLFNTSLELSNWGRKLVEEKLLEYNNYFINYFYEEKRVQYKIFLAENPQLIRRVALKDLATYLNVIPQSLSRIRAEI